MQDVQITDFTDSHFQKAFKLYCEELGISFRSWDAQFVKMNQDKDNLAYIRLANREQAIGFIQFKLITLSNWFFTERLGFIREFWVAPEFRGRGNGRALLQLAENYFKDNLVYKAILTTASAAQFYESNGYARDAAFIAENKDNVFVKHLE